MPIGLYCFPLALYWLAVDNGLPWRLPSVPAVLLALYRRAVVIGLPWRLSFVYCPAWVSFRPAVRSCWLCYFSDVAFIRRLRFLLAHYCPAVVLVRRGVCRPFLRFVRLLAFYRRAVSCWHSIALRW